MAHRRTPPNEAQNSANTHMHERRAIPGATGSPPERAHHTPAAREPRGDAIVPGARDADARHKQHVGHGHDAFWRKMKR